MNVTHAYFWGFGIAMFGSGIILGTDSASPENTLGWSIWAIGTGAMLYAM